MGIAQVANKSWLWAYSQLVIMLLCRGLDMLNLFIHDKKALVYMVIAAKFQ